MKKTAAVLMAWLVATVMVQASDNIEKKINVNQRIPVALETQQILLYIDLPPGQWSVSGSASVFAKGAVEKEQVYLAASLSKGTPTIDFNDGKTITTGSVIWNGRADPLLAFPSRVIHTTDPTTRVYIMLWVHLDDGAPRLTQCQAYGFITARPLCGCE